MTRRDWVLAGAAFLFMGAGLSVWMTASVEGIVVTLLGGLPLALGLLAFMELANRSLR